MYNGLLHLHNLLRWLILLFLLIAIIQALAKSPSIRKSSLWLLICAHLTFLVGIYQWFAGEVGYKILKNSSFKAVMENDSARFWVVEHIFGMLIAIILITIGRGKAKVLNYRAASWLFLIALIIILATIPWPFREGIGRPWFPGMK
ncbi:MAG TPA: hypothetical protein VIS75_08740 [Chitinophagaceae bacterium]